MFSKGFVNPDAVRGTDKGTDNDRWGYPSMAKGKRSSGPWWYQAKGKWFVWHEGRKVNLGTADEREAVKAWHRLMAGLELPTLKAVPPIPTPKSVTVGQVVDGFLSLAERRVSAEAYRGYAKYLRPLADAYASLPVAELTPEAVALFLDRKPKWGMTYRAGFHGTASQMFRAAVKSGTLVANPMDKVKKPPKASRGSDALVSEEDHQRLLVHAEPVFGDFLRLLWLTGARPGELTSITGVMVKRMSPGVLPLLEHKTAHKGKGRTLILSPDAVAVLQRRAEGCEGRLFPWDAKGVTSRMRRASKKAGVKAIAYGYRHTFATDALARGVPDATVAALLGHADTSMVHRHYSHLSSRTQALKDALNKVRG